MNDQRSRLELKSVSEVSEMVPDMDKEVAKNLEQYESMTK